MWCGAPARSLTGNNWVSTTEICPVSVSTLSQEEGQFSILHQIYVICNIVICNCNNGNESVDN